MVKISFFTYITSIDIGEYRYLDLLIFDRYIAIYNRNIKEDRKFLTSFKISYFAKLSDGNYILIYSGYYNNKKYYLTIGQRKKTNKDKNKKQYQLVV